MTTPVVTPQQSDPYAEFGGSIAAAAPASTPSPASPASSTSSDPYAEFGGKTIPDSAPSQEQQLQDRIYSMTQHSADLKSRQMDNSGAEYDKLRAQQLLAEHQGIKTDHPGWMNELRLGTPTPGTTSGLQTPGDLTAGTAKETVSALWHQAKNVLPKIILGPLDPEYAYKAYQEYRQMGQSHEQAVTAAEAQKQNQQARIADLRARTDDYMKHPNRETGELLANTITALLPAGGEIARLLGETGEAAELATATEPIALPKSGLIKQVIQGENVAQPGAQTALRNAPTAASETAAARAVFLPLPVQVPDEYKNFVDEAMKTGPQWTPAKAQPLVKADRKSTRLN